ncbi:unnamed protein product [Arabis nemorensis]|uniref:FBD domain-containing protein n=1 Tax=Arabis nemorensis TaxID=586526 RepID=A0A565BY78_9BRAS|nr:unnamed protein product [Arabis nemorensis]
MLLQGLDGYTSDVTRCPFQVKVLHVLGYGTTAKELEQLKSLLGGTESLEVVRVQIAEDVVVDDAMISQTYSDLMTLLGVSVSSKCQLEISYFI